MNFRDTMFLYKVLTIQYQQETDCLKKQNLIDAAKIAGLHLKSLDAAIGSWTGPSKYDRVGIFCGNQKCLDDFKNACSSCQGEPFGIIETQKEEEPLDLIAILIWAQFFASGTALFFMLMINIAKLL